MTNRLAGETSPYLLQHADNPVHWEPWDETALARARAEGKPILLSIGYSACHWCHVMAHESFEDEEVADVMNRLFVNIKVDREERPDLDQIYQVAQQMLTGQTGGWPLTLFLTPDGAPFYGGTYFPKTPRYGRPGFPDLCERVAEAYAKRKNDIAGQNEELLRTLGRTNPRPGRALPDGTAVQSLTRHLLEVFDPVDGGFGGAPKFPHPTDLAFLLRRQALDANGKAGKAALLSLTRMAEGGINDQLAGGFCRYSVDERWEIPHFEKMLYDNGPLLSLYADAYALSGVEDFRRVAAATAGWVMGEMQSPAGGYYSSLDADSEGEEGKFYVWDRQEIRRLLTVEEWAVLAPHWGLDSTPNFEGHWHLKVDKPLVEADRPLLESARAKLLAVRAGRIRPGLDDKILTSWNALMIAGMARGARVFGRSDWLASARRAADFIHATLWRDGRLLATCKDGKAHLNAYLDDYAYLLDALIELMQADFRAADLAWATALADALLTWFEDGEQGGFFFTSHDHETLIHRPKPGHDNATPAGNGVAALALQRLGHLVGETRYLDAAERTLKLYAAQLADSPAATATLMMALEEHLTPPTIVVLRGPAAERQAWAGELAQRFLPSVLVVSLAPDDDDFPLPAALDKPETDQVNAWVCRGVSCLPPISGLEALLEALLNPGKSV